MKKILLALSVVFTIGFMGCGGGDSQEAKELLQRILKLVGIPQDMVVTICQDSNNDGICATGELQTKIAISQGDGIDDILKKLETLSEDTYFMDNYNPIYPILLILKDEARVAYNGTGKFGLSFGSSTDGVSTDYNNTVIPRKELSILESMIDAKRLTKADVLAVRGKVNSDGVMIGAMKDVDQFYNILLEDLATNVETLGKKGLNPKQISDGNIKEMAEELLANGIRVEIPAKMNACNGDQACINGILNPLSVELLITDAEAEKIAKEQRSGGADNPPATTKRDMILTKETQHRADGTVEEIVVYESKEKDTTTMYKEDGTTIVSISTDISKYENSKHISNTDIEQEYDYNGNLFATTKEICISNYDTQNRYIGESCIEKKDYNGNNKTETTSKEEYIYSNSRVLEHRSYTNSKLDSKVVSTKWNGDNVPIEYKYTRYKTDGTVESTTTYTVGYTGKDVTRIDWKRVSAESTGEAVQTMKYDSKKNPYDYSQDSRWSTFSLFWLSSVFFNENNLINQETTGTTVYGTQTFKSKIVEDNKIVYNSSDFPTRIDKTQTSSYENGHEPYVEKSYTTYEYKKVN